MSMGFRRPPAPPGPPKTGGGLPLAVGTGRSSNPDKLGIARPVPPPAPTTPDPTRTSPINKALTWLINALQLQNQTVPRDLAVSQVLPVLDVDGFAGWGLASYTTISGLTTGNAQLGALHEDSFLVVPDPVNTQIVVGLEIVQTITNLGALQCEIGVATGSPVTSPVAGTFPLIANFAKGGFGPIAGFTLPQAPAVGFAPFYLASILGGIRYIVAPPGYGVYLSCFNQSAGQIQFAILMVATIPGAFGAGR